MRKPQRAYRDALFRDIFNNADRLPEIYEALLGIRTTASDITLATINETLFSGIKNDVGFIVGSQHVLLTEHQSTTNANMPLRMLMYLAEVYRRYVDADAVYRKRLIPLPAPKFYVFYNGIEKMPDTWSLHLSDAFEGRAADLELAVEIININHQPGRPILEKCHALKSSIVCALWVCFSDMFDKCEKPYYSLQSYSRRFCADSCSPNLRSVSDLLVSAY